jgi:hypothetical protein
MCPSPPLNFGCPRAPDDPGAELWSHGLSYQPRPPSTCRMPTLSVTLKQRTKWSRIRARHGRGKMTIIRYNEVVVLGLVEVIYNKIDPS